jgi:organic hydroperoxide reductase OsmC/OhrA
VEVHDATVDVRASFSPAEKFGLDASVGAFDQVTVTLDVRSPAPAEQVRRLVAHAERGCHSSQSLQARVPVWLVARLNGDELEPDDKEP